MISWGKSADVAAQRFQQRILRKVFIPNRESLKLVPKNGYHLVPQKSATWATVTWSQIKHGKIYLDHGGHVVYGVGGPVRIVGKISAVNQHRFGMVTDSVQSSLVLQEAVMAAAT